MRTSLFQIKKPSLPNPFDKSGGFSLIELLLVIAILGILAGVAVPLFLGERTKAVQAEAKSNLETLRLLEEQFFAENGDYTALLGTCAKDNDNIATIQASLPGFHPGSGLKFSYCLEQNIDINGAAQTPCFRARAFGNSNTPVEDSFFVIDCNNNRNF